MKYFVFSDIDGTLYKKYDLLAQQTIDDVSYVQEKGIQFVLATGNPFMGKIKNLVSKLNTHFSIMSNGASIFDHQKNKLIYQSHIQQETAQKILDFANHNNFFAIWWTTDKMFCNNFLHLKWKVLGPTLKNCDFVLKESNSIKSPITKMEIYTSKKFLATHLKFVKNQNLATALMQQNHLEITNHQTTKGDAIKWMSKFLKFDLEHTMGIGDSTNDLTMLEVVNYSYAMANAKEKVKKTAKYHTSDVLQNGLGEALHDYLYRMKVGV